MTKHIRTGRELSIPRRTGIVKLGVAEVRLVRTREMLANRFHAASTTLSAQQSVPWYAKESLFGARGLTILVTTLCLWLIDRFVLVPLKLKGRYFILHAAGNAIAVILTFNGMVRTLLDPVHAAEGDVQIFGYCVVVAIHLYHVLAFRPLPQVEWVHHVLMIGIVGPVVFYYARGAIIDYCSFFLSGLPGGIDYVMLVLVKNGRNPCNHMYRWLLRWRTRVMQTLVFPTPRPHHQGGGEACQQRHQHLDANALWGRRSVHPLSSGAVQEPRLW